MTFARRAVPVFVAACAALFATGCGSNKDRIIGKWKVESGPGMDAAKLPGGKAFMYMDFAKDGTMKLGIEVTDPAEKQKLGPLADMTFPGKYTVSGDNLELHPADGDKGKEGLFKPGENTA